MWSQWKEFVRYFFIKGFSAHAHPGIQQLRWPNQMIIYYMYSDASIGTKESVPWIKVSPKWWLGLGLLIINQIIKYFSFSLPRNLVVVIIYVAKCDLGKVKFQADAVSGLLLKRTWSCGVTAGTFCLSRDLSCISCCHFWADLCGFWPLIARYV